LILLMSSNSNKEPVKFISAIVRDIHRVKVRFPVVNDMLLFHQAAESWVERANVAIRSRISLDEIKILIQRGRELPLDLSEYLEKLESRVDAADEWLTHFAQAMPWSSSSSSSVAVDISNINKLELTNAMRRELDKNYNLYHELATEGSRIPVEVDCVKLLQVELDARAWSAKARRWLPPTNANRHAE